MNRRLIATLACVSVLAFGAACSDDNPSPEEKASKSASAASKSASAAASTVCTDLDKLQQDADKLKSTDPATTDKAELQSQVDAVKQDLSNVSNASKELGTAAGAALTAAAAGVKLVIDGIDSSTSVQSTVDALKKPLEGLSSTVSSARSALHCTG